MLPLPDDAPGGEWWVSLAVLARTAAYTPPGGDRARRRADAKRLGPITVP